MAYKKTATPIERNTQMTMKKTATPMAMKKTATPMAKMTKRLTPINSSVGTAASKAKTLASKSRTAASMANKKTATSSASNLLTKRLKKKGTKHYS